jgi:rare lipoprotein A
MRNLHLFLSVAMCFIAISLSATQEYGMASVYSPKFQGSKTANGETFNHNGFTAAHRTLPFGTLIRITRTDNGKSVVVRINDRGPFVSERITDISKAAASKLKISGDFDEVRVKLEVVNDKKSASGSVESSKGLAVPVSDRPKSVPMPDNYETVTAKGVEERTVPREYRNTSIKKSTPTPSVKTASNTSNSLTTLNNIPKGYNKYGLYAVKMNNEKSKGYAVQVASLTTHSSMMNKVSHLKEKSFDNVLVNIVKGNDGDPDYKILLGPFDNIAQAETYLKGVKKKNVDGFVVGLE